MAVIFDQAQGQYIVNKPIAPTAPTSLTIGTDQGPGSGGGGGGLRGDNKVQDLINKTMELEQFKTDMENYEKEMVKYEQDQNQADLWNREDRLRKEVQEREDNALQRWVNDARRAGINPNLALGATGAASGGGITNASQKDYTLENTLLQGEINQALADLERAFQKDENAKDRLNRVFSSLGLGAIMRIGK